MSENQDRDEQVNMDAILGAALDELDDDDDDHDEGDASSSPILQQTTPDSNIDSSSTEVIAPTTTSDENIAIEEELHQLDDMMKEILSATNGTEPDAAFGAVMEKLQQQMAAEMESIQPKEPEKKDAAPKKSQDNKETTKKAAAGATPPPKPRPVFGPEPPPPETDVDRTISKLLNDMATASVKDEPTAADGADPDMDDLLKEFEKLGGEDMIDGMMQQMLSKDLMYEPMKEVTAKFPKWLEDNKGSIPEEEYLSRCKQYQGLKHLISVYDNEPDNSDKLMDLMKEVQEYGLPPSDIVSSIAPDLKLDEDGVPQLNPMQDCCIM